jgi:hypothetical protein
LSRKAKTYRAEAAIELSVPLFLGSEFSGLLKPATIGGIQVHVVLPGFRRGLVQVDTTLHPRAQVDWLDFFKRRNSEDDRDWPFGGVSRWEEGGRGGVGEFSVHRLLVLPKRKLTIREGRKLKAAVDDWVGLFELWVEVVTRADLHRRHVWIEHQGRSAVVWLDRGETVEGGILAGEQKLMLNLGATFDITPWQWGKMLMKASESKAPPEAHIFLRDARNAANLGHHRRSVLDSATAAELALAKLRDESLAASPAHIARYVRKSVRQFGRLAAFLEMSRTDIPTDADKEIGIPRNEAIHAGHELDEETAEKALARAEQIVDLAFPWKKLLGPS